MSNAVNWEGNQYARVNLAGTLSLTNFRTQPVEVEVTRNVLGNVVSDRPWRRDFDGKRP